MIPAPERFAAAFFRFHRLAKRAGAPCLLVFLAAMNVSAADDPGATGMTSAESSESGAPGTVKWNIIGGLEYDSFLHSSSSASDSVAAATINPTFDFMGHWVRGVGDVEARAFVNDTRDPIFEAHELYITNAGHLPPEQEITVGRRNYDLDVVDDVWNLGLWSPRFLWDPLHPETLGRTGIWYEYKKDQLRFLAELAPVVMPEQSFPLEQQNGQITSVSPFWNPPPSYINIGGNLTPVNYTIQYPSATEIIFRMGFCTSIRYGAEGNEEGLWGSAQYGYFPMKNALIAVQPGLGFSNETAVDVTIHPLLPYHHLATVEAGYNSDPSMRPLRVWSSLSREIPVMPALPSDWYTVPVGPAWIGSVGASLELARGLSLTGSYLETHENVPDVAPNAFVPPSVNRFLYEHAWQTKLNLETGPRLIHEISLIQDLDEASSLVSVQSTLLRRPGASPGSIASWSLSIGADLIFSQTGAGEIGQYLGDDNIRWTVSYAF